MSIKGEFINLNGVATKPNSSTYILIVRSTMKINYLPHKINDIHQNKKKFVEIYKEIPEFFVFKNVHTQYPFPHIKNIFLQKRFIF